MLISSVIANFTARTSTVFGLLVQVVSGLSRKAAWARLQELGNGKRGLSLRSCYRLWVRLLAAQTRIRTALFALVPPPVTSDARPFAQLLAHLRVAFAEAECCLMQFQRTLQCGVFY